MDILQGTNESQRRAITSGYGPVMIVAGPGTGKTKTLTARIAYLLQQKVSANAIVALTFTNKAAQEMRERLTALCVGGLPTIATFHALCLSILQTARPERVLRFATDSERAAATKHALKVAPVASLTPRDAALAISRYKGASVPDSQYRGLVEAYDASLRQSGLIDFDDLLLDVRDALVSDAALAVQLRNRYQHILIDEFQDTSTLQWQIVQLLRGSDSVFVIGDPKQSIYGFRGASQDMFAKFRADFPASQEIALEINYRSQPHIVRVANVVFPDELPLRPARQGAGEVQLIRTMNEFSEADAVLTLIEQGVGGTTLLNATVDSAGRRFSDFAILYRTHHTAKVVQQRLHDSGIPYQVVGEGSPYEQPIVRAVIESMRWLVNQEHVPQIAGFREGQVRAVLESIAINQPASRVADAIIAALALDGGNAKKKLLLKQFVATLVRFDHLPDSLHAYIAYAETLAQREFYDSQADAVTLMTVHASKGLEFAHVLMLGVEEGIMPHLRKSESTNIAEERRLFYVALTRAQQELTLFCAQKRAGESATLSRFVRELPADCLRQMDDPLMAAIQKRQQRRQYKKRQATLF